MDDCSIQFTPIPPIKAAVFLQECAHRLGLTWFAKLAPKATNLLPVLLPEMMQLDKREEAQLLVEQMQQLEPGIMHLSRIVFSTTLRPKMLEKYGHERMKGSEKILQQKVRLCVQHWAALYTMTIGPQNVDHNNLHSVRRTQSAKWCMFDQFDPDMVELILNKAFDSMWNSEKPNSRKQARGMRAVSKMFRAHSAWNRFVPRLCMLPFGNTSVSESKKFLTFSPDKTKFVIPPNPAHVFPHNRFDDGGFMIKTWKPIEFMVFLRGWETEGLPKNSLCTMENGANPTSTLLDGTKVQVSLILINPDESEEDITRSFQRRRVTPPKISLMQNGLASIAMKIDVNSAELDKRWLLSPRAKGCAEKKTKMCIEVRACEKDVSLEHARLVTRTDVFRSVARLPPQCVF